MIAGESSAGYSSAAPIEMVSRVAQSKPARPEHRQERSKSNNTQNSHSNQINFPKAAVPPQKDQITAHDSNIRVSAADKSAQAASLVGSAQKVSRKQLAEEAE